MSHNPSLCRCGKSPVSRHVFRESVRVRPVVVAKNATTFADDTSSPLAIVNRYGQIVTQQSEAGAIRLQRPRMNSVCAKFAHSFFGTKQQILGLFEQGGRP